MFCFNEKKSHTLKKNTNRGGFYVSLAGSRYVCYCTGLLRDFFMEIKIRKLILPKSFSNFVAGKAVLIEKAILYLDPQMIIINMKLYPA